MKATFGFEAAKRDVPVEYDTSVLLNGHGVILGVSGTGKSFTIKKFIRHCLATLPAGKKLRIHVLDVHGDIDIEGASEVMFSETSPYGFVNPLKLNPDPDFGGVRKQIQGLVNTMNSVMPRLGGKQEACLRNILTDLYANRGFDPDDSATWNVDDERERYLNDGKDRLYIDVPRAEKDEAKALGARWDPAVFCWWVTPRSYAGDIKRWQPKMMPGVSPTVEDAVQLARGLLVESFMGSDEAGIVALNEFNSAASQYQKAVLAAMRKGGQLSDHDDLLEGLEKKKATAIERFTKYVESVRTGHELEKLMKYDSTDVLKSVLDRLENLKAMGLFKSVAAPFREDVVVWRYKMNALLLHERRLAGLFKMQEIFLNSVQRGEVDDVQEIIIADEAHIYADDDSDNILAKIGFEGRKFGLALVAVAQSPKSLPEDFIKMCGTKVILGIDESEWRAAATRFRVEERALAWTRPREKMLVQLKRKGHSKNDWIWTIIADPLEADGRGRAASVSVVCDDTTTVG